MPPRPVSCLQLLKVTKQYCLNGNVFLAVRDIDLAINHGEIISLVGPSGCGKSTVLNLAAGFLQPTSGEIHRASNSLGVIFQTDAVFPWMTVKQNISYGLQHQNHTNEERDSIVAIYLEVIGLSAYANRWPRELSGGMRKRVELARAYAYSPDILLMDEPFGFLDVLTKAEMHQLLLTIWQKENKSILFVTHDIEEAIFLGHRVVLMTPHPGTIQQIFHVPFNFPRDSSLRLHQEFIELRREITQSLTTGSNNILSLS